MNGDLNSQTSVTALLQAIGDHDEADEKAANLLFERVYTELRKLAGDYLRRESRSTEHTLQATALVHEAYLRLVGGNSISFQNRAHFFSVAAQVMRNILVDHARRHRADKRGAGGAHLSLDDAVNFLSEQNVDLIRLDEALDELARLDADHARIVELKFFGGLNFAEIAAALGATDEEKIGREWRKAKMWLKQKLKN